MDIFDFSGLAGVNNIILNPCFMDENGANSANGASGQSKLAPQASCEVSTSCVRQRTKPAYRSVGSHARQQNFQISAVGKSGFLDGGYLVGVVIGVGHLWQTSEKA
jgi:hypothetical protein